MSVVPKTRLPMRIIALPLTGYVRGPRHTEEPSPLVYYHFQTQPKAENRRGGWIDWATGKAASFWVQFGKAPENSWKVCRSNCLEDWCGHLSCSLVDSHLSSSSLRMARSWSIALTLRSWPSKAWILQWVPKSRIREARARTKRKPYLFIYHQVWDHHG
jgi:hypothetical protein